jgi:hypothetical protein
VIGRPARAGLRLPGLATFDAWRRFRELDRLVQRGARGERGSVADWLDRRAIRDETRELKDTGCPFPPSHDSGT